ncbi:hypothetical protein Hanom_Chr12g01116941 [Helianthus anomalus]
MELFLMLSKGKIPFTIIGIDTCDIVNVEVGYNSHDYFYMPTSALLISQVSIVLTIVNGILPFVNIKITPLQVSMSLDTHRPMPRDPPLPLAWSAP